MGRGDRRGTSGQPALSGQLAQEGIVDEYRFLVTPVVMSCGGASRLEIPSTHDRDLAADRKAQPCAEIAPVCAPAEARKWVHKF